MNVPNFAFQNFTWLTRVDFSNSIKQIGAFAFYNCERLRFLDMPSSLAQIDLEAFCGCTMLKEIEFHDNLKEIGIGAFISCPSLRELNLPASLESIGAYAFYNSNDLRRVMVQNPSRLRNVGYHAFANCQKLTDVSGASRPFLNESENDPFVNTLFAKRTKGTPLLSDAKELKDADAMMLRNYEVNSFGEQEKFNNRYFVITAAEKEAQNKRDNRISGGLSSWTLGVWKGKYRGYEYTFTFKNNGVFTGTLTYALKSMRVAPYTGKKTTYVQNAKVVFSGKWGTTNHELTREESGYPGWQARVCFEDISINSVSVTNKIDNLLMDNSRLKESCINSVREIKGCFAVVESSNCLDVQKYDDYGFRWASSLFTLTRVSAQKSSASSTKRKGKRR